MAQEDIEEESLIYVSVNSINVTDEHIDIEQDRVDPWDG